MAIREKLAYRKHRKQRRQVRELHMRFGAFCLIMWPRLMPLSCKLQPYYTPQAKAMRERCAGHQAHWANGHIPVRVQNMLYRVYTQGE